MAMFMNSDAESFGWEILWAFSSLDAWINDLVAFSASETVASSDSLY